MNEELLRKAQRHLTRRDRILQTIIRSIGPCTLTLNGNHFDILVRAIVSQQISTKAAQAISAKLVKTVGRLQPKRLIAADDEALRQAGLSTNKRLAIRDLAEKCQTGLVPIKKLAAMENEAIIESLVQVRGIGRWTAEMFLIFSLGRPDVLPVGDYGLRAGVQQHYELDELPRKETLHEICEAWKPYRSIGTWYIWRSLGGVPQSE